MIPRRFPGRARSVLRAASALAAPLGAVLAIGLAAGCEVSVQDGVGPRVPIPDVEGTVVRDGAPGVYLEVDLRNVSMDSTLFETETTIDGHYGFAGVRSSRWEVRVESDRPGDFDSVSYPFFRDPSHGRYRAPALDISARGAALERPAEGDTVTAPTPFVPMVFHWSPPAVAGAMASVQLIDTAGADVWRSAAVSADSVRWTGFGTEGAYYGLPVGPGLYAWRVKFEFPDTIEARTTRRTLRFE